MFINEHLDIENRASWKQMGRVWKHVSKVLVFSFVALGIEKHAFWKHIKGISETRRSQHVSKRASCYRKTYMLENTFQMSVLALENMYLGSICEGI